MKLIFQHSEDTLPGGAKELVEKGVLENPEVDAILAMHMMPDAQRVEQIAVRSGPVTTSVDLYDVTVTGQGGHGSASHTTQDPILVACQMIVLMQQIVARRVDPLDTAILFIGSIHRGDASNVIPGEAKFSGIARAYTASAREVMRKQMFDIAKGMEDISGCTVHIHHYEGYPTTYNDPELMDVVRDAVREELGPEAVVELPAPCPSARTSAISGR